MSYDLLRLPGNMVSFSTVSNPILPAQYQNVTVEGVVGYRVALGTEDISSKFLRVLPFVQMGTDPSKAEYVILTHTSGEIEVLALAWIDEDTIVSTTNVNKIVTLSNVPSSMNEKIMKALRRIGIQNISIEDV